MASSGAITTTQGRSFDTRLLRGTSPSNCSLNSAMVLLCGRLTGLHSANGLASHAVSALLGTCSQSHGSILDGPRAGGRLRLVGFGRSGLRRARGRRRRLLHIRIVRIDVEVWNPGIGAAIGVALRLTDLLVPVE